MTEKKPKKNTNMEIWDFVEKTVLADTQAVAIGSYKFTAIDAYSQIKKATELWGPIGIGWGWLDTDPLFPPNDTVVIKITLWYGGKKDQTVGPIFGQKKLNKGNSVDEDAFKKAVTDGVTKCLSLLGFNADVFLGKFEDNKYIESLKKEEKKWQGPLKKMELKHQIDNFSVGVDKCTSVEELKKHKEDYKDVIEQCLVDNRSYFVGQDDNGPGPNFNKTLNKLTMMEKQEAEIKKHPPHYDESPLDKDQ